MSTFDVAEYESFHNRLRTVRKQLKINQAEVAGAIGIAQGALSKMEAGDKVPSIDQVAALEAFFAPYGVPTGWLTGSGAQHAAAVIAESGDFILRAEHEAALASARATGVDAHEFADRIGAISAELLTIANDLLERAPLATRPLPPSAVAAAVTGVLEGQVSVEDAIQEATITHGTPEDWADTTPPPTPFVTPLPPAPLPSAPYPVPTIVDPVPAYPLVTQTQVAPPYPQVPTIPQTSPPFAAPQFVQPAADPLATIFGAPAVVAAPQPGVAPQQLAPPPFVQPAAIDVLVPGGFAQPVGAEQ